MATILVVEDDESVLALLETNLLTKGHDVRAARTGAECLELLEKSPPGLVILDLMLPDTDGFELLDHIRSSPETEHTPVLILTARGDERDRVRGLAAGADDYLVKPFYATELLLRIDRLLATAATGSSLRKLALTDRTTGLGNRAFFETRLEQLKSCSDHEERDLAFFVVDLPGIPEAVRKKGWKSVDAALSKIGSTVRGMLLPGEEAFWLGTQCVITSLDISSGAHARERLDKMRAEVKATLDSVRRQVSLVAYFGYCFYQEPESSAEIFDKIAQCPYGTKAPDPPRQSARKTESSIDEAFGGKLTGLAPVDYVPEQVSRKKRTSGEQKIDRRLAMLQMRQLLDSSEQSPRTQGAAAEPAPGPGAGSASEVGRQSASQPTDVELVASPSLTLPRLQEGSVSEAISAILAEARAEPHDVAVCCLAIEGIDETSGGDVYRADSVESVLDSVVSQVAFEVGLDRYEGSQAFWTGRHLFVAIPAAGVEDARGLARALGEIASTKLLPYRASLKVSATAGYVFYDLEESASRLLERAKGSPYKGGVLVTPLEARKRAQATQSDLEPAPTTDPLQ